MQIETTPLVEAMRGETVESQHRGVIVTGDAQGDILYHLGDSGLVSFTRSSARPFQGLTVVESGAVERYRV